MEYDKYMKILPMISVLCVVAALLSGCGKPVNPVNVPDAASKVSVGQVYRYLPAKTGNAVDDAAAMAMRDKQLYIVTAVSGGTVVYTVKGSAQEGTTRSEKSFLETFELQK